MAIGELWFQTLFRQDPRWMTDTAARVQEEVDAVFREREQRGPAADPSGFTMKTDYSDQPDNEEWRKFREERDLSWRALICLGVAFSDLRKPGEPSIDVIADTGAGELGIEVTKVHVGEGSRGSRRRAEEKKLVERDKWPRPSSVPLTWAAALERRVRKKAMSRRGAARPVWLLCVAQVPEPEAVVPSTLPLSSMITADALAGAGTVLRDSMYERAVLYLAMEREAWSWSRDSGWSKAGPRA